MHTTLRPFATAGVALVGATAIAITPVAPTTLAATDIRVASPAVQLTAAVDPITPWLEVFNNSQVNFASLVNTWLQAPAPVLQQVIANQIGYLSQLPDFPAIIEQMVANLGAAIHTPLAIDPSTLENTNPLMSHRSLYTILSELAVAGTGPIPIELMPLINFTTTYTSGILLGLVGPVIGPMLALAANLTAIVENLTGATPDLEAAFGTLINTPANMADAFLNGGQSLDIMPVLKAIGLSLDIEGVAVTDSVRVVFGGLLSPGGSMFNALEFDMTMFGRLHVPIPGHGPGFIGSVIGLTNAIAKAIGWDGVGNPLAPPLTTPETPDPETPETPNPASLPDTAMLASKTVTLEASKPALAEKVATVEENATSTGEAAGEAEPATTPAVVTPEEETTDAVDETVDETVDEAADDAANEAAEDAADEAAEDAANDAADEAADEAKSTKPGLNGSKPGKDASKSSATKTSQSDGGSDADSSKSSDNKSDD